MTIRHIARTLSITILGLTVAGCGDEPVEETTIVRPVKMIEIGEFGTGSTRELPGTIRAAQNADMSFEVGGQITDFLVTEGQDVTEGTELARLDPRNYQADFDQADAGFRKAQADLARSERIYQQDPGAISTSRIESDRKALEVAEAALRKAQKAVEDTVLRAPFSGLVARRLVEDFENVQPKEPILILQDISFLEIEVAVPERDVAQSAQRRAPEETTRQINPRVQVSSLPGLEFPARLVEFSTTADPATRTFQARLTFDAPEDQNILPGMTARVIYNAASETAITLPSHAAFSDSEGNPNVWIADPSTMQVSSRPVTLGTLSAGNVEVLAGLESGDLVVVSGVNRLREDMQVRRYGN